LACLWRHVRFGTEIRGYRYHPESLPRVRNVLEPPDEEIQRTKSKDGMEENQSISVEQIQKMLGSEQVNALAAKSTSIPHKSHIS